jgi:LmbE family N-acetylglucosaminyl deacetylase
MVTPLGEGAILRASKAAEPVSIQSLTGQGAVLVLTPHPDDESLGCGGAIAAACAAGTAVTVVSITDGRKSHPNSKVFPTPLLIEVRQRELQHAVAHLTQNRGSVMCLGKADQGPLCAKQYQSFVRQLCDIVDEIDASALWTTWEGDPHPDHQIAADLAHSVCRERPSLALWRFPIWGRFTENYKATEGQLLRFDTSRFRDVKAKAIACHLSQMTRLVPDDPEGFVMDPHMQQHFIETSELFLKGTANG